MKILTILVGPPGSGKSHSIKECGLENMTISSDLVRIMNTGTINKSIPGHDDSKAWAIIMSMLENRMRNGSGIILDSTGLYGLSAIKKLKDKYGYRINYIHFDHLTVNELKKNLKKRSFNNISDSVLEDFYKRSEEFKVGSDNCYSVKELGLNGAFRDTLKWYRFEHYKRDFSNYDKIYFIGDPHGNSLINEFLDKHDDCSNQSNLYIFLGDLCDRGDENLKLLNRLMAISEKNENVLFVEGNHDRYLNNWASDNGDRVSSDFITTTQKEFDSYLQNKSESEISKFKKSIRLFYRTKIKPFYYFNYKEKDFFINHSGVDLLYMNIPTSVLTGRRTVGYSGNNYDSYIAVADEFARNHPNIIQIFGHRNVRQDELEDKKCKINNTNYCVDCQLSYYNDANILVYSDGKFSYETYKNKKNIESFVKNINISDNENPFISIKKAENLHTVNFTRRAFYERVWNSITVKARGLYLYDDNTIAGRSYNKFFNFEEMEETSFYSLKQNLKFPVSAYKKYNGFLGLVFYDKEKNKLRMASKKTLSGTYPSYIDDILTDFQKEEIIKLCKTENVTCVFEVEHMDDPHIIEKQKSRIVLLDIIDNSFEYNVRSYQYTCEFAKKAGLEVKSLEKVFNNFDELEVFINDVKTNIAYDFEGFVLCDSKNFNFKLKTIFYNIKKFIRSCNDNGQRVKTHSTGIISKLEDAIYYRFCHNLDHTKLTMSELQKIYIKLCEGYK